MTATLEEIHNDPEIIDRAISRSERLDIVSNGVVTATFTPTKHVADVNGYASAKRLSPIELGEIAAQLASAPDDEAAEVLKEKLPQGFYGEASA
jgi:hypothetical protein